MVRNGDEFRFGVQSVFSYTGLSTLEESVMIATFRRQA
jgi:hypothetical protein